MAKTKPEHQPTDKDRATVESMSSFGIPQPEIAKVIGIDPKTLRKHYRHELDIATAKANAMVAQSLYKKAIGDHQQSVTAAIFWLKTRAGWKDPHRVEVTGEDGGPLRTEATIDVTRLSTATLEELLDAATDEE